MAFEVHSVPHLAAGYIDLLGCGAVPIALTRCYNGFACFGWLMHSLLSVI